MTSLTLDDDGRPVLEIADQQGEVWVYTLGPAPLFGAGWTCTVEREPDKRGLHTWRVARTAQGEWWCQCPDHEFRGWHKRNAKLAPGAPKQDCCKHVAAVRPLAAALALFLRPLEVAHVG